MKKLCSVIILAGGLATRLRPMTETIPKALISIHNEPFIYHQLRLLNKQGIRHVILCLGYLGEMVESCVGDGSQFGMTIEYAYDGPMLLGTAGAIKKTLPLLDDVFFVLYGDSYLNCDYLSIQAAFFNMKKPALMTIFHNKNQWDGSNVDYLNGRILSYSKRSPTPSMSYIDYGLGMFHAQAFDDISITQPYDLSLIYENLSKKNQLAGIEIKERFFEIGSFTGIKELEYYLHKNQLNRSVQL